VAVSRAKGAERTTPPEHSVRGEASLGSHVGGHLRERTADPGEAEEIISRHYLANRLHFPRSRPLEMDLAVLRIGGTTSGRLSYGQRVRQLTAEAQDFHVNMPVRGHAVSRCGQSEPVLTAAGQGLVFSPEEPAEISWSPDCVQLCLKIPRAGLEAELERLLGRSVRSRLRFDFGVAPGHVTGRLQTVLILVAQELDQPSGLATNQVAGRHLEGLMLDGLLLGQPHNYSEAAVGFPRRLPSGTIKRAVELIEERPGEPWTTVGLATELRLSVRALQAGFKRELGMAPMAHLRMVRLRRARTALMDANPAATTVRAVAVSLGLLHQGRFAVDYRAAFGEMPSETLRGSLTQIPKPTG
jgi:AraC-like DNA-binding protein